MTMMKWMIYTVLLALLPVLMRASIATLVSASINAQWFNNGDIISFGLILAITNISGLEHASSTDADWKTMHLGVSLLLVAAFATLFAIACFDDLQPNVFEHSKVLLTAGILSMATVLYSYAVWQRLTNDQTAASK